MLYRLKTFTFVSKLFSKLSMQLRIFKLISLATLTEWLRAMIFHYCAESFDHLTPVSNVGSRPTRGTCQTSQVLLAGVSGGFSRGSPVFAPPSDWPVSYELKKKT